MRDRMRCPVCGRFAEVWHPDGEGDQQGWCGLHEPEDGGGHERP